MRWTRGTWLALCLLVGGCEPLDIRSGQLPARSRIVPEPPGAACAHGGQAVQTGLDQDGDGALEDHEVTSTEYVCDEDPGAAPVLVRTGALAPGAACPDGGQVTQAGLDLDGDGVLDDAEVTREVRACTRDAPVLTRLRPVNTAYACASNATLLEAGKDTDGDGALDDAEVQAAHAFCMADSSLVRHALQPEPAGGRCGRPGTRVDAWFDQDGDGEQAPGLEPLVTLTVCQPARVHDGHYLVASAADLAALQGITRVDGDLQVTTETLGDLRLPELSAVMGTLRIVSNLQLAHVALPGLRFARSIELGSNPALETAAIGTASGSPVFVEELLVQDLPLLASLEGLSLLAPHKGLGVVNVPRVEALSFPHVTALSQSLSIGETPALKSLSFPALRQAGNILLGDNGALESLAGFPELQSVHTLSLVKLSALTSVEGMDRLQSIENLLVERNPALETLALPQRLQVGLLDLWDNPALVTVGPLNPRSQVTRALRLSGNPLLRELKGLPDLVSLEVLEVSRNPMLTDLSALGGLVRLGQLLVVQNDRLTDLSALSGLRELTALAVLGNPALQALGLDGLEAVSTSFAVRDNPLLPTCRAQGLADRVYTGQPTGRVILGNDDAASCPAP
ncbi:hypothetical protein [Corallococcus exercitus]|uniref:DUF7151 family protein n=1 Tax=Corallococcus exercitus TaxID=2316736 RepID=UPI0035D4DA08